MFLVSLNCSVAAVRVGYSKGALFPGSANLPSTKIILIENKEIARKDISVDCSSNCSK